MGVLQPSAHAIDREYRAISAMYRAGLLAARPILYSDDEDAVGTAFYLFEYIAARVFWCAEMPGAARAEREAVYDAVNACLARLHCFDIAAPGLEDFGRPDDYVGRQLHRWSTQYRAGRTADPPDMDWLIETLAARQPPQARASAIHGDDGLHNIIIHPSRPEAVAVLDREISTLGDLFADLAHHLMPYFLPPDRERHSVSTLAGRDLPALGVPDEQTYVDRHCARAGFDGFADQSYYIAFAMFRYAAIIRGILKRVREGSAANKTVLHTPERVALLARTARRLLD